MKPEIDNILMYQTSWCSDCTRADMFFSEYDIEPVRIDIETDSQAAKKVEEINKGNRSVPTIVITMQDGNEQILVEPSYQELKEAFL